MAPSAAFAHVLKFEAALAELKRNAGTQFDPVVAAFADLIADRGAPRIALAS